MSTSDDIVIVETTDYAQVVFEDVKETFTNARQLECAFTLNELLKADESDWIGIYKVGFENCNDYLANVMLDLDQVKENKGKVVFPSESIKPRWFLLILKWNKFISKLRCCPKRTASSISSFTCRNWSRSEAPRFRFSSGSTRMSAPSFRTMKTETPWSSSN